jgi:CxxC motif-containing protein (DUF1111 family)
MNRKLLYAVPAVVLAGFIPFQTQIASSQTFQQSTSRARDPGVRDPNGPKGAGGHIEGLSPNEIRFFEAGKADFEEVEDVADGLGPRMNLDGCGRCHSQPATGGTSPAVNPQVAFAKAANPSQLPAVYSFIMENGPIREARFVKNRDGTLDGGVHALFTIAGRPGADVSPGPCKLAQPNFQWELDSKNVIFRIPTPVFGAGLIEQIPDTAILAGQASSTSQKRDLGIRGRPNFRVSGRTTSGSTNNNGNDGTISRFGWKAQNQTLLLFSGEAYNVEMGITSELFQVERDETPSCQFATVPNDTQNFGAKDALTGTTAIQNFANFQRFLAPPTPSTDRPGGSMSIQRGKATFSTIGCALCHTPTLHTGNSTVAALNKKAANLYSNLLVHDMGVGLADGVTQGQAGPREFRTSPLWGLGKRIFFLHDGRTSDLVNAIQEHSSNGSEANGVVRNFSNLPESQKQDLLNFLRSL